jgi:hypothetical protein
MVSVTCQRLSTAGVKCPLYFLLFAFVLSVELGCASPEGPERVAVSGKVTIDGKALPAGVIRFIPTSSAQGPATAANIQNGVYELAEADGPILGTHRVEIEGTDYLGFAIDDEAAFAATVQKRKPLPKNPVPPIYNRQSTLSANVTADGPKEFNFELASTGKQQR